jgi:hypothetical protein
MSRPSPNILLAYEPADADHLEQVVYLLNLGR